MSAKSIQTLKGLPLIGNLIPYQRDRLGFLQGLQSKYGDRFKVKLGPKLLTVLTDPADVEHVMLANFKNYIKKTNFEVVFRKGLFTSNGQDWKEQRVSLQNLFTRKYLASTTKVIGDITNDYLAKNFSSEMSELDLSPMFAKITFEIIVELIIGENLKDKFDELNTSLTYCTNFLTYENYNPFPWRGLTSPYSKDEFDKCLASIDSIIYQSIKSQEDVSKRSEHSIVSQLLNSKDAGKLQHLNDDLIRDNIAGLLFAGYETTALTLCWLVRILSNNPEIQDKVRKECQSLETINSENLAQLNYTEAVLNETMRLYPAGWAFTRIALEEDEVRGLKIAPGEIVFLSPYLTHRSSYVWDSPEEFRPERFINQELPAARFAYFPFGGGPRLCIGKTLAMIELKVILAELIKKFEFHSHSIAPIPFPLTTLGSKNGFWARLKRIP